MQREPKSQRNKLCEAKGRSCNAGVPRTRGFEVIKNETKQMNVTYKEPRIKQAGTRTRKVRVKGGAAKEQDVLCSGAMQPSSCSSFLRQWWDLKGGLGCIRARDPVHKWQRAHHARRGARLYNHERASTRIILSRKELALTALCSCSLHPWTLLEARFSEHVWRPLRALCGSLCIWSADSVQL